MSRIKLKSRKKLFLNTTGQHPSALSGDGLDFKEIREYTSGDDIRHLNWKVTARTNNPSVNIFNEEKQIQVIVVYLHSGSMYFGSKISKHDYAKDVSMTLCNSACAQNDIYQGIVFGQDVDFQTKPSKNQKMLNLFEENLNDLEQLGSSVDYEKLNNYLLKTIKKRSLIFLVGDFLEIPKFSSLAKKHEIYCAIVRDKIEENLNLSGEFSFVDTNNFSEQSLYLDSESIKAYNQKMQEHDRYLLSSFRKSGIRAQKIYTHLDLVTQLYSLVRV